ncbi:hypothetical protein MMC07_000330 [Pseudocyphellaria aurata]|nr:hypothetical protein [Pseudocyphellaria aurata]
MLLLTLTACLSSVVAIAYAAQLEVRDDCAGDFSLCSPTGASSTDTPAVGDQLSSLFVDLLSSVQDVKKNKRDVEHFHRLLHTRASKVTFCCATGTHCLLLKDFNLPFCYDKFTTNFLLPGGAFGTIATGNFTSPNGDVANLISGDYTLANGLQGNVYGSPSGTSKPDTATLTLPTQFTAAGVGSAIPLTGLGKEVTYTTTIPGTTIQPSTVLGLTAAPSLVSGSTVAPGTTIPATIIPGTTIPDKTLTVTTKVPNSPSASQGTTGSSSSGASTNVSPGLTVLVGVAGFGVWMSPLVIF